MVGCQELKAVHQANMSGDIKKEEQEKLFVGLTKNTIDGTNRKFTLDILNPKLMEARGSIKKE